MSDPSPHRGAFRFPAEMRVRCRHDFDDAFRHGFRASDDRLTVWARLNGLPHSRLGIVVGRKYGGAVQRNRLKRLLREAFRLNRARLPAGMDLICAPRAGRRISLAELVESLTRLAAKLEVQLARRGG